MSAGQNVIKTLHGSNRFGGDEAGTDAVLANDVAGREARRLRQTGLACLGLSLMRRLRNGFAGGVVFLSP